jgi:hypothetical protein
MRTFAQKPKTTQQATPAKATTPGRAHFERSFEMNSILHLQRTISNQAVQRPLQTKPDGLETLSDATASGHFDHDFSRIPVHAKASVKIQSKLAVNTPGDIYEQEADRISEQVMRMPEPQLQHACACGGTCPKCQTEQLGHGHERLQTQRVGVAGEGQTEAPPIVHEVLRSPGQPIDPATRSSMESRFGHDFSRVRVHADDRAAQSVQAINAIAYTAGNHIAFGVNQYQPQTSTGLRLFAHELTHVVQQTNSSESTIQRQPAPTFPAKGIQVTGQDAKELVGILSSCTGTQLILDKDSILKDSGKKNPSKTTSEVANKQLHSLIKNPNGIIIDTDPNVPGAFVGTFRATQPGFHNVNIQQVKVLAAASGASGGFEACSAIIHEISEAANARALGVKGKTTQADVFNLSHDYGFDIENKIRSDFKLPARDKSGSFIAKLFTVDGSFLVSIFSNVFGTGSQIRTQLTVIKTPFTVVNNKPQVQGNEVLGSHVEMGTVALNTTQEGLKAFKKFFPNLPSQLGLP